MMKMMSLIMMIICATNAIDISGSIKPNNNNVLAALNAKVNTEMTIPGDYAAGLTDMKGPVPFTEKQFPYHGATHAESFRGCSKAHVAAANGEWQAQFVADLYGYYHDYGYLAAVTAQNYADGMLAEVWASDKTAPKNGGANGIKLGVGHEVKSVKLADDAITAILANQTWKTAHADMTTTLEGANGKMFKVFGHALIAGTPGSAEDRLATYNEGMDAIDSSKKLDPTTIFEGVNTDGDFLAVQAAKKAKIKEKLATFTKWGTNAGVLYAAAHQGDFCYLKTDTSVCQQMNCFAEFFSYGGVQKNAFTAQTTGSLKDELTKFIGGQAYFAKDIVKMNDTPDSMVAILNKVKDAVDSADPAIDDLAKLKAKLALTGGTAVADWKDKCVWSVDGSFHIKV